MNRSPHRLWLVRAFVYNSHLMMRVLTVEQMRQVDRLSSAEYGVPGSVLMENAGAAVAELILREFPRPLRAPILVLGGKGNNGGDGMVAARHLAAAGEAVKLWLTALPVTEDAQSAWARLRQETPQVEIVLLFDPGAWPRPLSEIRQAGLIVDAILGAGLSLPAQGLEAELIEAVQQSRAPVVAVDLPSGLPGNAQFSSNAITTRPPAIVRAQWTVTFTAPKVGHLLGPYADRVGRMRVVSIGTPAVALERTEYKFSVIRRRQTQPYLKIRAPDSHKGKFGHVLLFAGSLGKTGAAALAGQAALKIGSGLVTVATPKSCLPLVAGHCPELMTEPMPETAEGTLAGRWFDSGAHAQEWLDRLFHGKTIMALGPGLSQQPETAAAIRHLLSISPLPWVLDADGLNAFAGHVEMLAAMAATIARKRGKLGAILTPHAGEMARLLGTTPAAVQHDRLRLVVNLAARLHAIVILKGHRTLVAAPDGRVGINVSGNPGLAKGGSGDILTGIIASLWAQNPDADPFHLAGAAVRLHGVAADCAVRENTDMTLLASDVIAALPGALRQEREPEPDLPWEVH